MTYFVLVLAYPDCPEKEAVKQVSMRLSDFLCVISHPDDPPTKSIDNIFFFFYA